MKNPIVRNIFFLFLFFLALRILVGSFLRLYTHHGEKIEVPNWEKISIEEASKEAQDRQIRLVIEDSVFIIGEDGGMILKQTPAEGSNVKRNRKVYVTITKHAPDMIPVAQLPMLYGKDFERKKVELEASFGIQCKVVDYEYDQGEPEQIMRVLYQGAEIVNSGGRRDEVTVEKGGTLEFVLSKNTDGALYMPDLTCKTYDEAVFYLKNLNLVVGQVHEDGAVDRSSALVYDQSPRPRANIVTSDTVEIFISNDVSIDCN